MALDPLMKAEMQRPYFVTAFLFDIDLPLKTIRILDGAGEVNWNFVKYLGADDVFGTILSVDPIQEQVGTEAPMMRMKFAPTDTFSLAYITDPGQQGAPVNVWWATIESSTGEVVGQPYLVYAGELDAAEADIDRNETTVTLDVASVWERLFMNNEGQRLNNAAHTHVWAETVGTERGFEYVVAIQRNEPWGYEGPRPAIVADVINGQQAATGGGQTNYNSAASEAIGAFFGSTRNNA